MHPLLATTTRPLSGDRFGGVINSVANLEKFDEPDVRYTVAVIVIELVPGLGRSRVAISLASGAVLRSQCPVNVRCAFALTNLSRMLATRISRRVQARLQDCGLCEAESG